MLILIKTTGETAMKKHVLSKVEATLKKASFRISERCWIRPCCFDLAASKEETLLLVRVSANIGCISGESASELQLISNNLSASPLLIGLCTPKSPMGDDAVYERHGITAVTPQTLEDAIIHERYPLVEAKPGGFYVQLNGDSIRERRTELGLSLGELASMIGVSRRTIYGYERGLAKASVRAAIKLEATLGIPIVLQIDLFEKTKTKELAPTKKLTTENRFLNMVLSKFLELGFFVAATKRAPFDFIASDPQGSRIIGGAAEAEEKKVEERMRVAASIADVAKCQPLFIVEGKKHSTEELATIRCSDFMKIKEQKQLYDILG